MKERRTTTRGHTCAGVVLCLLVCGVSCTEQEDAENVVDEPASENNNDPASVPPSPTTEGMPGAAAGGATTGNDSPAMVPAGGGATGGTANDGSALANDPNPPEALIAGHGPGTMFETAISPLDAEKFSLAKYRIYIPDGIAVLRGVIIRQHGCGRNGIDMANDLQWQVLANKWAFALLGTHYEDGGNCGNWARLDSGSVQAMERAFAEFALAAQRPELTIVPWAIWGHSGGGNWAYAVGNDYPERVIAVIPRSGSNGALSDAARSVPQLLSAGLREENHDQFGRAYSSTVEAFERERPLGALVGLSLDPEATHDIREGRMLAIPYLDACIELRLPSVLGEPLRTIEPEAGWLGNIETFAVSAFTEYAGDPGSAAWLPSEEVAKRWAEFEATGQVVDTTPPPAPFTLTATREGADVRLSWTADADLESGIQRFVVYRDGVEVGSVGAPFQRGNFGDEPEPVAPEMAFVDAAASGNPTYEVTTVNFFDLESSRSPAARPE